MTNNFSGKYGPLLIAEIGGNHEGNFEYAKKLLRDALKSDVDVIKFLGHNDKTQIAGFIHIGTAAEEPNERPRPDIKEIVSKFRV